MGDREYRVGEYWIAKRRDGKSPDIWQIAAYSPKSRSVVYRSTKQRDLEKAKAVLNAHFAAEQAKKPQEIEDAAVAPQLVLYWKEHGQNALNAAQIEHSIRVWLGFFDQDDVGLSVTFAQLKPAVFERFRRWRMGAHNYSVTWRDKEYTHKSAGIRGESVQRNLDDLRAMLNHAAANGRVPFAPKVPSVATTHRSPARDERVTLETLGAMLGFTASDPSTYRWIALMIATAARPDACLAFDPKRQDKGKLLDMHPPEWPRTKKRNPVVPCIAPFRPILEAWKDDKKAKAFKSKKTAWRQMRALLELPDAVVPKTIRHTIATELRSRGVPADEISGLLGHMGMNRTTAVYAKYDPAYLAKAAQVLTTVFAEVLTHAEQWAADHLRTKALKGQPIRIDKKGAEAQDSRA